MSFSLLLIFLLGLFRVKSASPDFIKENTRTLIEFINALTSMFPQEEILVKCSMVSLTAINQNNYTNFLFYTGHDFSSLGNPGECAANNYSYHILAFDQILNETTQNLEEEVNVFLDLKKVIVGLCIWKECVEAVDFILRRQENFNFYSSLKKYFNIEDIRNYYEDTQSYSFFSYILFGIIVGYFSIRLLLTIICSLFIKNPDEESLNTSKTKGEGEDFDEVGKLFKDKKKKNVNGKDSKKTESNDSNDYEGLSGIQIEESEESDDENEKKPNVNNEKSKEEKSKEEKSIKKGEPEPEQERNRQIQQEEIRRKNEENEDEDSDKDKDEETENDDESKISSDSLFERNNNISNILNLEKYIAPANVNVAQVQNPVPQPGNQMGSKVKANINLTSVPLTSRINFGLIAINDYFLKDVSANKLFSKQNKLFNSKYLETISGIRAIVILFMTLNELITIFYKNPTSKSPTPAFFGTIYFGLIKLSSYTPYCWVYLDGLEYTFKIFNYIKKDKSAKNFFILFLRMVIPKFIVFVLVFFGLYFSGQDLMKLLGKTILFKEHYDENVKTMKCMYEPYIIFLFPLFGYWGNNFVECKNCFKFSYLFVNEFNCLLLLFILIYVMYRFQSKIFDNIILGFAVINIIFSVFIFDIIGISPSKYTLTYVMGEHLSLITPNSMLNIFFIGVLAGIIYYYYVESMNELGSFLKEKYYPFSLTMKIMRCLIGNNFFIKLAFIILSSLIIIFLSILYFILKVSIIPPNRLLIDFNIGITILYRIENLVFIICFSILVLNLLFANDKLPIKQFFDNNVFFWFDRISFQYVLFLEFMIMAVYSLFNQNGIYWDYLYFWYLTLFIFIFNLILAIFATTLFELPFRLMMINLCKKKRKRESIFPRNSNIIK